METSLICELSSSCISGSSSRGSPRWQRARDGQRRSEPLPGAFIGTPGTLAQGTGLLGAQLRPTDRHTGVTPPSAADTGFLVFSTKARLEFYKSYVYSHPAAPLTANFAAGFLPLFTALCCCLVFLGQLVGNPETNSFWSLFSFFLCLKAILAFLTAGDCSISLSLIQTAVPTSQIVVISKRCLFPQKNSNEVTVCSLHSQPGWEKSKYPIIPWNS